MNHRDAKQEYQRWQSESHLPSDMVADLRRIEGDDMEIQDRFAESLDFGTGGLRGVMGAGLNRMNVYTVRLATAALADHVKAKGTAAAEAGVAIGYDCRHNSAKFAEIAACTLAAQGVTAYVAPLLCPTPELSWSVRFLGASAGIMITASHNPPEYNGYKVYNQHGGQMLEDDAEDIKRRMLAIQDVFAIPTVAVGEAVERGLFVTIPAEVRAKYIEAVVDEVGDRELGSKRDDLQIVYTPLHGTGHLPVREALTLAGYRHVFVLPSQAEPDGDFSTVKSPNPEEPEALSLAIEAARSREADLVMGTDPDADRVGIAVRDKDGEMRLLTGNQVGALLVDYMCRRSAGSREERKLIVFKTIVTSDFGGAIAKAAGVAVEDTLTGFKYIGDRITVYESLGTHRLLAGYEESYGYLISPIVRDKDAVQTCLAISDMVAYHKAHGETLLDVLDELYRVHGFYGEKLMSVALTGQDGTERMHAALDGLRKHPLDVAEVKLMYIEDYLSGVRRYVGSDEREERLTLPTSDVQKFYFEGGHWAAVRPSGTEPKMKVYVGVCASSAKAREKLLDIIGTAVEARIRG